MPEAVNPMPRSPDERIGPKLTIRQQECLRGVLNLKSAKEVARDLGISPHAVEKHLRIAREKFGVTTTAEAARRFSSELNGGENYHSGSSDLEYLPRRGHRGRVERGPALEQVRGFEEPNGAQSLDQPLNARQTLLAIAAVSFGSVIALLVLVACAEGVRSLVAR